MPVSTAEYNPYGWRAWLNNTTISLGMQNVFDEDPPFAAGAGGYDASIATIKGRFWYRPAKEKILTPQSYLETVSFGAREATIFSKRGSPRKESHIGSKRNAP